MTTTPLTTAPSYRPFAPTPAPLVRPPLPAPEPVRVDTFERTTRTPIVGQSRGGGGVGAPTLRGSLQDDLAARARQAPTIDPSFRDFAAQSAGDVQTVRTNLGTARTQMQSGQYAAAADNLRDLRENHSMGFLVNGRLGLRAQEAAGTLERQANVCARMETQLGHGVTCPPSEADARAYFRSFDTDARRTEAQGEFREYTRAFYTHTQQAFSPTSDVQYSPDGTQRVYAGRIYADSDRSAPAAADRITTRTPDAWADVTSRRQTAGVEAGSGEHAGRRVIDCEGYAYLSQTLMGEAGYGVRHVSVGTPAGGASMRDLHAMTELTDPRTGATTVQSNGDFYGDRYRGYRSAVPSNGFESPAYFVAPSMRDSQTLAMDPARP